jgi:hypothetical protein
VGDGLNLIKPYQELVCIMHVPGQGACCSIVYTGSLYLPAHRHHLGGDVQEVGGYVQVIAHTVSFILFTF